MHATFLNEHATLHSMAEDEEKLTPEEHHEGHDKDQEKLEMSTGKRTDDVYSEAGLEREQENDEITPNEEGFMEGENKESAGVCQQCNKVLDNQQEGVVEEEIKGEQKRFCSDGCAETYRNEHLTG